MIKSLAIAFSTYSKIPMPLFEWKEEDMKYCMCFFPVVGLVIGLIEFFIYRILRIFNFDSIFSAAILTAVPYVLNGGIHLDGFMDTLDALSSYGDKAKKISILKDPHIGAFSVIKVIVYILLLFGAWHQLYILKDDNVIIIMCLVEVMVRIFSGLSVVIFPKAKKDGMVYTIACAQHKVSRIVFICYLVILFCVMSFINSLISIICLFLLMLLFLFFKRLCDKNFGGISGDLAGWYLETGRLLCLLCVAVLTVVK